MAPFTTNSSVISYVLLFPIRHFFYNSAVDVTIFRHLIKKKTGSVPVF